jgi:hypothetical protein
LKTILTIAQELSPHIGIAVPASIVGSVEQDGIDLLRCITEAGQELQSRFDWPQLRKTYTITGAGAVAHNLPDDYGRTVRGYSVLSSSLPVRGSLSDEEFNRLTPVLGQPRYYRTTPTTIEFWPYIANPSTAQIIYITRNWLASDKAIPTANDDAPLIDDVLVTKGALWRHKRMKGQDFADWLEEYEGDLKRYSSFSRSERTP